MAALAFDTVVLTENGQEQRMDADTFLAMPLHARVRLILERRVAVFDGGKPVSLALALKSAPIKSAFGRQPKP
ncbi:MAG TPA: hypothetical protein VGM44_02470 [Polyangiaceae bacterium]|jgi:hypothetical protein